MAGVEPGAKRKEGKGGEGRKRKDRRAGEEEDTHDEHLEKGDEPLLNAIDEDALHLRHILGHPSHDISGAAFIKPLESEPLKFVIEFGAKVENGLLLEGVIEKDAEKVEKITRKKGGDDDEDVGKQSINVSLMDDFTHDAACHGGEGEQHQSHDYRA